MTQEDEQQQQHCYTYINSVEEFEMLKSDNDYVVAIYSAGWCGPCKTLKQWLDLDYADFTYPIVVIDIDEPDVSDIIGDVSALPTIEVYHKNQIVYRTEGFDKPKVNVLLNDICNKREIISTTDIN